MVASAYFEYAGPTIGLPGVWGYIALTRITMQKNAKVNREWLLLRNKQKARAYLVLSSALRARKRRVSFSSARLLPRTYVDDQAQQA